MGIRLSFFIWVSIIFLFLTSCNTEVVHDLNESQANEIISALQQQGIQAEKIRTAQGDKTSYAIAVSRRDTVQAWRILRQENLPRPIRSGLNEVFGKPGLVPTATQEKAMMHAALAGEIAKTLQSVDGVIDARVHVVLPTRDPLSPADAPPSTPRASVLIRTTMPSPISKSDVQKLVAGSIDGLQPEGVTVVMIPNNSSSMKAALIHDSPSVKVGPFFVAAKSANLLRITLIGGLSILMLLSIGLILMARRYRAMTMLMDSASTSRTNPNRASSSLEMSMRLLNQASSARAMNNKSLNLQDH